MKNLFKSLLVLAVGLGGLAVTNQAHAADGLSVKLEPGVAIPVTDPQADRFHIGGAVKVQPLIGLTSWLDIGPSVNLMALFSDRPGIPAGTVIGLGGGARVKRPHDESNTGSGWSAVSPWADFDVQYVRTAELNRPGLALGAGASVPTSASRQLWVGPFARYEMVFQENHGSHFDTRNSKTVIAGVSFELGPKAKPVREEADTDSDGTPDSRDRCPYVPGPKENQGCPWPVKAEEPKKPEEPTPAPVPEVQVEIKQKVQFLWNSAVLEKTEHSALDQVVAALLENVDYHARVEGHASSEGQVEHNQKLSEKRAQSVVNYLVSHGVSRERLTAVGFGSSVPVADNATKAGREANRRVEFVINLVLVKGSK